ncbi:MAG: phosphonate ABC transporter substrate-binding protein [Bradyrhizobiaceae bacterium]|nr:phosphonate ABC transporter substrate-binding protein [Bradyrhizobiaceae bacterium]
MFKKLCTALALGLGLSGAYAQDINFGIISTEATQNLKADWQPLLDDMAKQTGLKIRAFFAPDYAGIIEGMRFNKVQVAWYGNKSAMEAVDRANGEVFAQSVDFQGNQGYWSHVVVHVDSPIASIDDVLKCDKSIDFGIGDPNSTSGFLVPTTYIFAAKNVDPKECFKTVRNASHEANAMAVANKQVAAATNNSENLRRLEVTAPEAHKKLKVVWTSPLIPSDPLVWRKDLDPALKSKLYTFIMTYGRLGTSEEIAAARKVLAGLQWAPFRPSSDAQLYPIRQLELNKQILKIKSDAKLGDAEKATQLTSLQKEVEKINTLAEKVPSM